MVGQLNNIGWANSWRQITDSYNGWIVKSLTQKSLLCLIRATLWGDTDNIERHNKAGRPNRKAHLVGITMGPDAR